jgi:hypothetical protein
LYALDCAGGNFGFQHGAAALASQTALSRSHALDDLGRRAPFHQRKQGDTLAARLDQIAANDLLSL